MIFLSVIVKFKSILPTSSVSIISSPFSSNLVKLFVTERLFIEPNSVIPPASLIASDKEIPLSMDMYLAYLLHR